MKGWEQTLRVNCLAEVWICWIGDGVLRLIDTIQGLFHIALESVGSLWGIRWEVRTMQSKVRDQPAATANVDPAQRPAMDGDLIGYDLTGSFPGVQAGQRISLGNSPVPKVQKPSGWV
jgi:hypothetical protein